MFGMPSRRRDRELDRELRDHAERLAADYVAQGMSPQEAVRQARLELGGFDAIKEECRDVHSWRLLEALLGDIRLAFRGMLKNPGFAAMVVTTLALGIGANTAMFSLIRGVFLRPLPYPEPRQLVSLWESDPERGVSQRRVSGVNFVEWEARCRSFQAMGVLPNWDGNPVVFNVVGQGSIERVPGVYASSGLFRVLGVSPLMGNTLGPEDDRQRGRRNLLISHSYWQERFHGDPDALGRTIEVDTFGGGPYTVIGVMPPGFDFPRGARMWLSLGDWGGGPLPARGAPNAGAPWYNVFARLEPGFTLDQAAAELAAIAKGVSEEHPEISPVTRAEVVPLHKTLVGEHGLSLWILFGAAGCILAIGCANVANLMLARGIGRRKELAARMALGATRPRIAFHLIVESLVLCALGAAAGLVVAGAAQGVLARLASMYVPLAADATIDLAVLGFAAFVTACMGVLCGLAPLMEWRKLDWKGRGLTEGRADRRLRQALVVSEVALAVVLVAAAGLLVRTLANLQAVDVGFQARRLLAVSLDVTATGLRGGGNAAQFLEELLPRLAALPGATGVAASTGAPLEEAPAAQAITRQDRPAVTAAESPHVIQTGVTPDYFQVMGLQLRSGRTFTEADSADGKLVAVLNETAARRYWPDEDPIGKRFAIGSRERFGRFRRPTEADPIEWREIVGIVADMRSAGFSQPVQPEIYHCYKQFPLYSPTLIVRTEGDPSSLTAAVRREVAAARKNAVVTNARTIEEIARESLGRQRMRAVLLTSFSALALVLGALGIYGVLSYTVGQRTQEIGIRMALGAGRHEVSRMVVGQALSMTAGGILTGLAGALVAARWMASLLFGVKPLDLPTFVGACLLLLAVAALASYAPARRATRVDPIPALRGE